MYPTQTRKVSFVSNTYLYCKGSFQNQKPAKLGTLSQPLKPPSFPSKLGTLISKILQNKCTNLANFQTPLPLLGQCPKLSQFLILEASLRLKVEGCRVKNGGCRIKSG